MYIALLRTYDYGESYMQINKKKSQKQYSPDHCGIKTENLHTRINKEASVCFLIRLMLMFSRPLFMYKDLSVILLLQVEQQKR